jgi:hypothetical protein
VQSAPAQREYRHRAEHRGDDQKEDGLAGSKGHGLHTVNNVPKKRPDSAVGLPIDAGTPSGLPGWVAWGPRGV